MSAGIVPYLLSGIKGFGPLVELSAVGHGLAGNDKDTLTVGIRDSQGEHFGRHGADAARREVDHAHHAGSGQLLQTVVGRQLGAGAFNAELLTKVDPQFVGGLAGFRELFCLTISPTRISTFWKSGIPNHGHP